MRKLGLIAAASLMALFVADAKADDGGRIYYKDGTRLEFKDFDMKINLVLQPRFSYNDFDSGGRRDAGLDSTGDTTGFDVRRARVYFSGNLLSNQFSYKLSTDFRESNGSNDLKDAWLQYNTDYAKVRAGQFKVPFSRQENIGDTELEFIDRSAVSDVFSPSRQNGLMVHGDAGEGLNYYVGSYNGDSSGEGRNRGPADNKLAVYAAMTGVFGDYGTRAEEGDLRDDNRNFGATGGVSVIYGQASGDPVGVGSDADYDRTDLNVDLGARVAGLDLQSEFYYSYVSFDDTVGGDDNADLFGFYAQAGYTIDKEWQVAGRFGYFMPDDNFSAVDETEEYNLVLNYFLNGHSLKLQNGITFEHTSFADDTDVTDFRFETQLSGWF